jgi:4-hydroxy 2-oxovalerate aldolase
MPKIILLDCTLRDGGYYNDWNFPVDVINDHLHAMKSAGVNVVEIGFRSLQNKDFKGACAFSTDQFINSLNIPAGITLGVMINGVELLKDGQFQPTALEKLFPEPAATSPIWLVRVACHPRDFVHTLPASAWLKKRGFIVSFNLMQASDLSQNEAESLAAEAAQWPLDVLYIADSTGSMNTEQTAQIIGWLRKIWSGAIGIHTHDNMSRALQNCLEALQHGVSWVDATVTGMGRGPACDIVPLMRLIQRYFHPMQSTCGWGPNAYYYLSGKYGIHPSYIQEMLGDTRYNIEDILAVIEYLRKEKRGGVSANTLDSARNFYHGEPHGTWQPDSLIRSREVLILGTGPGVAAHRRELQSYIQKANPFVLALNTQTQIDADLINARVACHHIRLMADCATHNHLPQPLITPVSMLPESIRQALQGKILLDFGLGIQANTFEFAPSHCVLPTSLVFAYALAVATSGKANRVLLAGFDGYGANDPRTTEVQRVLAVYQKSSASLRLLSITPTCYSVPTQSIYAL